MAQRVIRTVHVGSLNPVKLRAVREVVAQYSLRYEGIFCEGAIIEGRQVGSGVSEQPLTLDETIQGACARAKGAFPGAELGIGLESGLMVVPRARTGHMDVCVCAAFDGNDYALGLSSAFELPMEATRLVTQVGKDINEAFFELGLTKEKRVGYTTQGAIGLLTKGRVTRQHYTEQAVRMALIQAEFPDLYT